MSFVLSDDAKAKIAQWKADGKHCFIGVDIGATNTRVGIAIDCTDFLELLYTPKQKASELLSLFSQIGDSLAALGVAPCGAGLAVAGPIAPGRVAVDITNWGEDNRFELEKLPESLFPKGRTTFLNDLEACCHGILALNQKSKLPEFFETLWGEGKVGLARHNHIIMAMGTGLGVAMLLYRGEDNFDVVPMEFGHALVTRLGPKLADDSDDAALLEFLSAKLYGSEFGVEFEDICSGRGLVAVYEWLCTKNESVPKFTDAGDIAYSASNGNQVAIRAVYLHYKFLIRAAQNCCVGLQAKGVLLAGDNQVKNRPLVYPLAAKLHTEFLSHPKGDKWLGSVPLFSQNVKVNANMIGALHVAETEKALH